MNDQQNTPSPAANSAAADQVQALVSGCVRLSDFTADQQELAALMSEISEECYCAGWMSGLEYSIWGALQDGDRQYGMSEMDSQKLEQIRHLSETLGGWVVWADDETDPQLKGDDWGERFVPMDLWQRLWAYR